MGVLKRIRNLFRKERPVGEVKDEIKGDAPKRKAKKKAKTEDAQNILDNVRSLRDELSELTATKDDDVLDEGEEAKPENTRKAATLRACHSLLTAVQNLLEDY